MPVFTEKQKQVIQTRNRDVLVSAAAGSGKTTVLVERILSMITDETHPIDIDHLLIVTFTRAAASDMREKIRKAIEAKSAKDPKNVHLQKQAAYVFHSQITTIDSFCNYLVKNYFYTIGIEPDFRMLEAGELRLLEEELMDDLLEDAYAGGDEAFLRLADAYARGTSDGAIAEMVFALAGEALTDPWPMEWLDALVDAYCIKDEDDLRKSPWLSSVAEDFAVELSDYEEKYNKLRQAYVPGEGTVTYEKALLGDGEIFSAFSKAGDYEGYREAFLQLVFLGLGNGKGKGDDASFRAEFAALRASYKAFFEEYAPYFEESLSDAVASLAYVSPFVQELVRLTRKYLGQRHQRFMELNAWDFNDIEHFALEILLDATTHQPTEVAMELQDYFEEVMVDEYQDSNFLQETILRAITRESKGDRNYVMVGDVKQSIYRFRQARPEIFGGKFKNFLRDGDEGYEDAAQQVIELNQNFRSRRQILDATNDVFLELMDEGIGGVAYDKKVSLKYGATYYPEMETEGEDPYRVEILLGIKDKDLLEESDLEDKSELEAVIIANKIRALMGEGKVYDGEGGMRTLRYRDICVLLRSSTNAQSFCDIFTSRGIPAYVEKKTGFFDTMEVSLMHSLLQVLDNPMSDIPLAAVMHSVLFGFTNEELANIRLAQPEGPFFTAVFSYENETAPDEKLARFFEFLNRYRTKVEDTPIHTLLTMIYEETGYLSYVSSLPGGEIRKANLLKLVDLAISYESTSYRGLFRFNHYIARLIKYETQMGEADIVSEEDDAVRIMTIHKSKGLEFPVVFLAEMGKKLNMRDANGEFILHPSLGLGLSETHPDTRIKRPTLLKKCIARRIRLDSIGEEMRILYVAMTRAKEKLILTGTYEDKTLPEAKKEPYTNQIRRKTSGYGGWVLPILMQDPVHYPTTILSPRELVEADVAEVLERDAQQEELRRWSLLPMEEGTEALRNKVEYRYPYETSYFFKPKYSVSELKHRAMESVLEPDTQEGQRVFGVSDGALRGTAMHRFMELFDFRQRKEPDTVEVQIKKMQSSGRLPKEEAGLLDVKGLNAFVNLELAKQMEEADRRGQLYREQPFVMGDAPKVLLSGLYPDEAFPEDDTAPMVLVQGIIDAFFIDEEGITLIDYKTDRIRTADELIDRYRTQMDLYADALEQSLHKKVIKRVLYSFALNREVVL